MRHRFNGLNRAKRLNGLNQTHPQRRASFSLVKIT
jgi:hypothetical protein